MLYIFLLLPVITIDIDHGAHCDLIHAMNSTGGWKGIVLAAKGIWIPLTKVILRLALNGFASFDT